MAKVMMTVLLLITNVSWAETWVCLSETFVGDTKTASGNVGTASKLSKYTVEGNLVRYYDDLMTLNLIHNDDDSLVAVRTAPVLSGGKPSFSYLFIDKVSKGHVFDLVQAGDDRSRDEGDCELAN